MRHAKSSGAPVTLQDGQTQRAAGGAGKTVLAAVVHQHRSKRLGSRPSHAEASLCGEPASGEQCNGHRNRSPPAKEAPAAHGAHGRQAIARAASNTHNDTSSLGRFGRLFCKRKARQRAAPLIDSMNGADKIHEAGAQTAPNARKWPSAGAGGVPVGEQAQADAVVGACHRYDPYEGAEHDDDECCSKSRDCPRAQSEQVQPQAIEFKFDLIVDELGAEDDAAPAAHLLDGRMSRALRELVESFVLDSNDACLMSVGRQQPCSASQSPSYLCELAGRTLTYAFQLLERCRLLARERARRRKRETRARQVQASCSFSSSSSAASTSGSPCAGTGERGRAAAAAADEEAASIDVSAILLESAPNSSLLVRDLLVEQAADGNQGGQGAGPIIGGAARHCDEEPSSVRCLNSVQALEAIQRVRLALADGQPSGGGGGGDDDEQTGQVKAGKGLCERQRGRATRDTGSDDKPAAGRREDGRPDKRLIIFIIKLRQSINGGLFSKKLCVIDFNPKFTELNQILSSIFNGRALAYLKSANWGEQSARGACFRDKQAGLVHAANGAQTPEEEHHRFACAASIKPVDACWDQLRQAEWFLYKQLSSALIRTLIVVHVHKLDLEPESETMVETFSYEEFGLPRAAGKKLPPAKRRSNAGQRAGQLKLESQLTVENLQVLEFSHTIQRASNLRLRRRKRHLRSHLASSNTSIAASKLSSSSNNDNNNGNNLHMSTAARLLSHNEAAADDDSGGGGRPTHCCSYLSPQSHHLNRYLKQRKASLDAELLVPASSRQQQLVDRRLQRLASVLSGGGGAAGQQHSARHQHCQHQVQRPARQAHLSRSLARQQHRQHRCTDLTESSSMSTSSGSYAAGLSSATAARRRMLDWRAPRDILSDDSDSVTSAYLNSCSSSARPLPAAAMSARATDAAAEEGRRASAGWPEQQSEVGCRAAPLAGALMSADESTDQELAALEDNLSDTCSVAEPPKQLKLEQFLNQLKLARGAGGLEKAPEAPTEVVRPQQQVAGLECARNPASGSLLAVPSLDEDDDDCKSHSSILEHLSSLALESMAKLNAGQTGAAPARPPEVDLAGSRQESQHVILRDPLVLEASLQGLTVDCRLASAGAPVQGNSFAPATCSFTSSSSSSSSNATFSQGSSGNCEAGSPSFIGAGYQSCAIPEGYLLHQSAMLRHHNGQLEQQSNAMDARLRLLSQNVL